MAAVPKFFGRVGPTIQSWRQHHGRSQMSLEINYKEREGIAVLELNGQLTFGQEDLDFRNELDNLLKIGKARVFLNLSDLRRLDNSGMGALIFARARLR
jgi:anti-anti-sigma regulatory factor